jgi:hypothetical protein
VKHDIPAVCARASCEQLLTRHYGNIDAGRASESLELFAEDAAIEVPGAAAHGTAQIADLLTSRQQRAAYGTMHHLSLLDFGLRSENEAHARGAMTLYTGPRDLDCVPDSIVRLEATFRLADDQWRIAKLSVFVRGHHTDAVGS